MVGWINGAAVFWIVECIQKWIQKCILKLIKVFFLFSGLLQKGDGSILDFKTYPKLANIVIGVEGQKRALECSRSECDGLLDKVSPFLNIVSLTTGPDGSIYVGDYNLVRKVTPDGKVFTILQFG